jgi:serine/threonine protein kinase
VLIDRDGNVKVSDWGLSSKKWSIAATLSTGIEVGSTRWMAPERLIGESAAERTLKSDIWSLAMTILEILTDKTPYHEENNVMAAISICQNVLPTHPGPDIEGKGLTNELWVLMNRCWTSFPKERPTAIFMEGELRSLSQSFEPTAWAPRAVSFFLISVFLPDHY